NVDFDEVAITREVFRDGSNEYSINGTKVRLRDILELLSAVSLGSTGHHIISQGEADRILNANIYDRRSMIEEALGLNIYQWKITESEKKLEKTDENIKQVESLRREIVPHLKFLKKQVEKIEKADELRWELKTLYLEYLKKEDIYLREFRLQIERGKIAPAQELERVANRLNSLSTAVLQMDTPDGTRELNEIEKKLRTIRMTKDESTRRLGRLEGMLEIKNERLSARAEEQKDRVIDYARVEHLVTNIDNFLKEAEECVELQAVKKVLAQIKFLVGNFTTDNLRLAGGQGPADHSQNNEALADELAKLQQEKEGIESGVAKMGEEENQLGRDYDGLKNQIERAKEKTRGAEREIYELRSRRSELKNTLDALVAKEERLAVEEQAFKGEIGEGAVLVNREILNYADYVLPDDYAPMAERVEQEAKRRQIEKIKIRLEDMGMEGTDVLEEYKEVTARDEYLAREHGDLLKSKEDLKVVILDLKKKVDTEFKDGISKINREFQKFFELMFGGGNASLEVLVIEEKTKEEEREGIDPVVNFSIAPKGRAEADAKIHYGVDINVNLPKKKIRGLQMLSGGERVLTSIALLFAMSQVNPPPFMILDETDAALDEANSRKYGDIIQSLSKYSQLILITHNRETMSRAGIIYGITMGADGISRLLSIKFDEATDYAKV
ncbi:MAG: hypothetical protein AAB645_01495, partial [Patescibacteria group bacterium]